MTKNETIFIGAHDGGIQVFKGAGNLIGFAKTPKMLAYILDTHKIFGEVMFTALWILLTKRVLTLGMVRESSGKRVLK